MSNALTLHDMSPGLRKVVGRESPRATLAEEPDAGNPLVRIWRGAELGNRSAYSTPAFSTARVPLPPCRSPARARAPRLEAAGPRRRARTGRKPGDGQPALLGLPGEWQRQEI